MASWDSSWVVLRHCHFITCWSLRAAEFLFRIWAQHHTTSFARTLIGDKVLSCIFFFQDVPGFGIDLVRQHWQHPPKKRTNTLFPLPFRAVERFFSLSIFFKFSPPPKNKPPGNIGLVVAGGPRLSWLWGCCGGPGGNDFDLRPPPFWRWKKRRPLGRHVWSPKLSEPNDLGNLGGWKWSLERKFGVTFLSF